jgi:hypothetical protein
MIHKRNENKKKEKNRKHGIFRHIGQQKYIDVKIHKVVRVMH